MSASNFSNKRIFPRYRLDLDCELIISGIKVNVKIIDFSIGGIGIILKDAINLSSQSLEIKNETVDIDSSARIVWGEEIFSGKRIGIQKTGLLIGNLSRYRLSDLLIGIQRMGKTGILRIDTDTATKKIYFKQGDMIFSASNQVDERMGEILIQTGKINGDQLNKSIEFMKKTGKRQGTALVELGYLTPDELIWAVRHQVEKIIVNLFNLEQANFLFEVDPLPVDELITLKLSTADLIYRGIKSVDDIKKLRKICPPLDSVLYFSSDPATLFQKITLDEHEKKIVSLIDGSRTIEEIFSKSSLGESETLKILYALFHTQIIEVIEGGIIKPSIVREDILEETEPEYNPAIVEKIESLYRDHRALGYHGILDINRNASKDEIKRAYYKMAKEFHPDRHLYFQSDDLKVKLNTIFAFINEAYDILSRKQTDSETDSIIVKDTKEGTDGKEMAMMKFDAGKRYLNKNNYEQALIFMGQALYLDNSKHEYHFYYGVALFMNKRVKEAEESIRKAIQLDPYNSEYIAELGHIYLHLGFKIRAKNTFDKALKYDPFNERASEGLRKISD